MVTDTTERGLESLIVRSLTGQQSSSCSNASRTTTSSGIGYRTPCLGPPTIPAVKGRGRSRRDFSQPLRCPRHRGGRPSSGPPDAPGGTPRTAPSGGGRSRRWSGRAMCSASGSRAESLVVTTRVWKQAATSMMPGKTSCTSATHRSRAPVPRTSSAPMALASGVISPNLARAEWPEQQIP